MNNTIDTINLILKRKQMTKQQHLKFKHHVLKHKPTINLIKDGLFDRPNKLVTSMIARAMWDKFIRPEKEARFIHTNLGKTILSKICIGPGLKPGEVYFDHCHGIRKYSVIS